MISTLLFQIEIQGLRGVFLIIEKVLKKYS